MAVSPSEQAVLYDSATLDRLSRLGEVVRPDGGDSSTGAAQPERIPLPPDLAENFDVLITSWSTAPFPPDLVTGGRLSLAVHSAGSIRALFPRSVLENGLRLAQGGSAPMAVPVAELALTLTLMLLRGTHWMDRRLQATRDWRRSGTGVLTHGLREQTVGIVGLSRAGREYARMLRGLGVDCVLAFDPYVSHEEAASLGVVLTDLDDLCDRSDVLAIHAPVTPETTRMIDADALTRLRDGAIVINTARSAVIDMDALTSELLRGRLSAGLDVFDQEPLPADSSLYGLENVLITPHVAGGTVEARFAMGAGVVDEIDRFIAGSPLAFEVTPENYDRLS